MDSISEALAVELEKISDIFINANRLGDSFYYPGPTRLTGPLLQLAGRMLEQARQQRLRACLITVGQIVWRCQLAPSADGEFYILRKMPREIMHMPDLGMPTKITRYLMHERLIKGGLIIVSGLPGNGKSTTLGSIIVDRLEKFGGFCVTIEDPIEMPLQGFHGSGFCLQRGVTTDEEFSQAIKDALRSYPSKTPAMMMIGEVRDKDVAALALRSAVDGRLVMFTMHAANCITAIKRFVSMASGAMAPKEVRELLASSFRVSLHQQLVNTPNKKNALVAGILLDTQPVIGTLIQPEASLENLNNDFQQQLTALKNDQNIELRKI
ncbi:ATPase, T2SS/T4P/T4SS family [Pseudomonas aeruginosa]